MNGFLQILSSAPSSTPMFFAGQDAITAGRIRAAASHIAHRLPEAGTIHLYTASAALFAAGLLAAARKGCVVCCPAHVQSGYLTEIGADKNPIVSDLDLALPSQVTAMLTMDAEDRSIAPPSDLDLVFYTSGSSGAPKTVAKSAAQLDAEARVLEKVWPNGAKRVLATVSHQHIYGMLFRVFWPVHFGGLSSDRAAEYFEQLSPYLVTGTTLVSGPAHLTRLGPLARTAPDRVFSSGGPLPYDAAQNAKHLLGSLPIEVLGSTETGGVGWRTQDSETALWTPLPDVDVAVDQDGFLSVRSPFAQAGAFMPTGDLAEMAGEKFRLKGRGDRVVKIDGKRVSLPRVENALVSHALVNAAAAIELPTRKGGLGAIVELNDAGIAALKEQGTFRLSRALRRQLSGQLEPAERPKHWQFASIPLTQQGKRTAANLQHAFDRKALKGTVRNAHPDGADITIELEAGMIWFEGHFPSQPVMPGIAQVHMAVQWAERLWHWRPAGSTLMQLKFRRVLRPGDIVELHLTRQPGRLKFAYRLGDIIASEGIVGDSA